MITMRRVDIFSLVLVGLALLYAAALEHMPRIEGALWPVVTPATISHPRYTGPPEFRHTWRAYAVKVRNCTPVSDEPVRWFLGPRDGQNVEVNTTFTDPPQIRAAGRLYWSGLVIDLNPDLVRTNSFAIVRHQCPGRFWETESIFYMSEAN